MIIDTDTYLDHSGVKGMRWGVRKKQNHPDVGNRKLSGRKAKKQARIQANHAKATKLVGDALKKPNDLILLNGRMVVTGKEFTDHMMAGGLLDIKTSRVYATQATPNSKYKLQ